MVHLDPESLAKGDVAFMNSDHQKEARCLNRVLDAIEALRTGQSTQEEVLAAWKAFEASVRETFAREEQAMIRCKFPEYPLHNGEHKLVLAAMEAEGRSFEIEGDAERLGIYAEIAMSEWLLHHVDSLDRVTARFLAEHGV